MKGNSFAIVSPFRFMRLFRINSFKVISSSESVIEARVGWPDDGSGDYNESEEAQDIAWDIRNIRDDDLIDSALTLGEFILDNKLISIDKIIVNKDELRNRIKWDMHKFDSALSTLLSFKVDMLDCGEKTDSFFVHF